MAIPQKTPEQAKADRVAREERTAREELERFTLHRGYTTLSLLVAGIIFCAIGVWFLFLAPGAEGILAGQTVVNLQRLVIGQTCSIVGAIFLAASALLRYSS
jgi:uncharacterized membrane protein YidH (DUF202 family)